MNIAFFDFDGTITKGDSFAKFIKFALGDKFYIKILQNLHVLLSYKMGFMNNHSAKEIVFASCFKNMDEKDFDEKCKNFLPLLLVICKQSALDKIKEHQQNNDKVVLVSASFESYLKYFCQSLKIELLSTKIEILDSKITGKFDGKNCYGIQKVLRIKEKYNLEDFEKIYAYGDTRGDKEMLEMADISFYRYFT